MEILKITLIFHSNRIIREIFLRFSENNSFLQILEAVAFTLRLHHEHVLNNHVAKYVRHYQTDTIETPVISGNNN